MTATAEVVLDRAFTVGEVDPRIFGSFVEHMGRAVYGGLFEPGHPTADDAGFRGDVAALVRELGVTTIRYPGGNFVSGYDWEDGVGPVAQRPTRLDLAWRSLETNRVGTDEFVAWSRSVGAEPMLAVNLGTRGIDAARALVEYCNAPAGTRWADARVANGSAEPHRVGLWCLGNEMDGAWQIGHKDAAAYGVLACEAGKVMRWVDPSIELVVCGSSDRAVFGAWEDTVLDLAWEVADHVSLHAYYDPGTFADLDAYLACSQDLARLIDGATATADAVGARRRSRRRVGIAVDEWNVWHRVGHPDPEVRTGPFRHAPALAEDTHTVADALVVGCMLITMLRRADRVRIACLAQLINTLAPIRTRDGGPAWRQTTYFPFQDAARCASGTVLRCEVRSPALEVDAEGPVAVLEATAVLDPGGEAVTVLAVNRSAQPLGVRLVVREPAGLRVAEHRVLADADPAAANTESAPERVVPRRLAAADPDSLRLPARSWNAIRLHPEGNPAS